MKIVRQKQADRVEKYPTTSIEEYHMNDPHISGANIIVSYRYPEDGFNMNSVSIQLLYVVSGSGAIGIKGEEETPIELGNCILIQPYEKYYVKGNLALFVVSAPAWNASQFNRVKS